MDYYSLLKRKISDRTAKIGVIGLGYVGLPLALEMAKGGFQTTGLDTNPSKVESLNKGQSYIKDVNSAELKETVKTGILKGTSQMNSIIELDAVSICVPTPLDNSSQPDLSYINCAVDALEMYFHPGILIILESTTYPGTTEELIERRFESFGYIVGRDYFLCYSPERIDPGNMTFTTKTTPKILGGTTASCQELGVLLYETIIDEVVKVSSPKIAEMAKLMENTFRSINIAFINEMSMICENIDLDIWEVIEAAKTKPFGFMPFYPGPGIGGHCIPLDPMYLQWAAKNKNCGSRIIELAQEINQSMPSHVVARIEEILNKDGKTLTKSSILLLGMSYKPDTDDYRESPNLQIFKSLYNQGASVAFYDIHIPVIEWENKCIRSIESLDGLEKFDCIVILTNHTEINYSDLKNYNVPVYDTRNAVKDRYNKLNRLGEGKMKNTDILNNPIFFTNK